MTELTQTFAIVATASMLLSACGGGSGSNSTSTAVVAPITVPSSTAPPTTPPPSPQFAPAPAPAPVVPFTFEESFDVTAAGGFSFRKIEYVDICKNNKVDQDMLQVFDPSSRPRLVWSQPAQRMRLVHYGLATEYGATQTEQTNNARIFSDQSTRLVIGWPSTTRYAKIASWSRRSGTLIWKGFTGEETQAFWALIGNMTNIPWDTSRSLRYEGTVISTPSDLQISSLDFTVFRGLPGDNKVSGYMSVSAFEDIGGVGPCAVQNGRWVYRTTLAFKGTFNIATNRFTGDIIDSVGTGYTGTFQGALFGPTHDEIGIIFNFDRSDDPNKDYSGIGIGTRYFL